MLDELPDAIKRVNKQDLLDLSRRAGELRLGAGRRSDWLAQNVTDDATGALRVLLLEHEPQPCYRCLIVVNRADRAVEHFSLDVLPMDYDLLPDVTGDSLLRIARWALNQIPISPLPADYQAEWDGN